MAHSVEETSDHGWCYTSAGKKFDAISTRTERGCDRRTGIVGVVA